MFASILFISTLVTWVPNQSPSNQFTKTESVMLKDISSTEIHVIKDFSAITEPNTYHYFSLITGSEVPAADANTTKWDLAFSGTTILTNGGASGSGQGGAIIVEKPFDTITETPKRRLQRR
jgi:hypothetical protein